MGLFLITNIVKIVKIVSYLYFPFKYIICYSETTGINIHKFNKNEKSRLLWILGQSNRASMSPDLSVIVSRLQLFRRFKDASKIAGKPEHFFSSTK